MGSAAAVIIGNEILSGKITDGNSPWLATRCRELGIDLHRIVVIPDDVEIIAETVRDLSGRVDHVFTSGGVGPTHDDKTMEGVALGFGVGLVRHPDLERVLVDTLAERFTEAARRMADVPEGSELWWEGAFFFPLVVKANVCIFPGVPRLLQGKFDAVAHRLRGGAVVHSRGVIAVSHEIAIAPVISDVQTRHPTVEVGSYPQFGREPWTVLITLDSRDVAALDAAEVDLRGVLGDLVHTSGS